MVTVHPREIRVDLSVNPCPVGAAFPVPPKFNILVPVVLFAATKAAKIAFTAVEFN